MQTVQTLGKYEIKRTLGRGAMGVVYEGWDPSIHRHVAIKTVPISASDDPEIRDQIDRFRREAQAAGRLTHQNIVPVYDYGETADLAYIVMEYVEGPTLDALLKKHERFGLPEINRIMHDLLAGLEFSHRRGVVHRDIKPANLMLTSDDREHSRVKIADFGIARIESSSMTQAGTMMGTPAYMSPEQFMAQTVDARTDIYSAGVLLYQLLTGERPFEGGMSAIMHKALNTEPPAPSQISVTAPPALDAVVKKAMAKRPDERFASAAAFSQALTAAASGAPTGLDDDEGTIIAAIPKAASRPAAAAAPLAAPGPSPVAKSSLMPILAGVALVLLVAGGGAIFWLRTSGTVMQASGTVSQPAGTVMQPSGTIMQPPAVPAPLAPRSDVAIASPQPPIALAKPPVAEKPADPPAAPALDPGMINDLFAQITASERCAFIGGTVRPNGEAELTGIAGPGVQNDIRTTASSHAVPGTIRWGVATADPMFCPAMELLQSVAPPFGAADPHVGLTLVDNRLALRDGERIRPRLVMPGFAGYLRLDYIAHDGNVQHLYPQVADRSGVVADKVRLLGANERLALGDPPPGQPAWEIGPPYGTDMIIAVASSEPLFHAPRSGNVEAAATYLHDLDAAIRSVRSAGASLAGAAVLVEALPK